MIELVHSGVRTIPAKYLPLLSRRPFTFAGHECEEFIVRGDGTLVRIVWCLSPYELITVDGRKNVPMVGFFTPGDPLGQTNARFQVARMLRNFHDFAGIDPADMPPNIQVPSVLR